MAYIKRVWEGRTGSGLNKYIISEEDLNGKRTITSAPDKLITIGDAISSENLNELEERINSAFIASGYRVDLSIDPTTFILTPKLYDINNNLISTGATVDLPLETMVVNAEYDAKTKSVILTLKSGATTSFSIADLIDGLISTETFNNHVSNMDLHCSTTEKARIASIPDKSSAIATGDVGYTTGEQVYKYIDEEVGNNVHLSIVSGRLNVTFAVSEYSTTESYEEGDLCLFDNLVKVCIQDTSGTYDGSNWENYFDDYDTTEKYIIGDICVYNSTMKICIKATTGTYDTSAWNNI